MTNNDDVAPHVYLFGKTHLDNEQREFHIRNDPIVHLSAGDEHCIVITESGRAFAFGANNFGQLGLGHTNPMGRVACIKSLKFSGTNEKLILAACGVGSSLVATNRGSLYAFGSNSSCQLGLERQDSKLIFPEPTKIPDVPAKISWKQIAMGSEHACALTQSGQVYTWGGNDEGQCGFDKEFDLIPNLQRLDLDYEVTDIACGNYHTALVSRDGRLFLFGSNGDGQLGRSIAPSVVGPVHIPMPAPVEAVACGNQHTLVLTADGKVYAAGRGARGQLGLGIKIQHAEKFEHLNSLPTRIVQIAAGEGHSAAIDHRGLLFFFGDGKHGKLGFSTQMNEFQPKPVDVFREKNVLKVVCGGCQTMVLAEKQISDGSNSFDETQKVLSETLTSNFLGISLARTKRLERINNRMNQSLETTLRNSSSRDTPHPPQEPKNPRLRVEPDSESEPDDLASNPDLTASMRSQLWNSRYGVVDGEFQTLDSNLQRDTLSKTGTRTKMLKTGALDQTVPLQARSHDSRSSSPRSVQQNSPRREIVRRTPVPLSDEKDSDQESITSAVGLSRAQPRQRVEKLEPKRVLASPRISPRRSPRKSSHSSGHQSDESARSIQSRKRRSVQNDHATDDAYENGDQEETEEEDEDDDRRRPKTRMGRHTRSRSSSASPERRSPRDHRQPVPRSTTNNQSRHDVRPVPTVYSNSTRPTYMDTRTLTNQSSPGFFGRVFNSKPSLTPPTRQMTSTSRACSIM